MSKIILIGPTESILTKRGNRFPNIADHLLKEGKEIVYYTSNFYHAEKRFFSKSEMKTATSNCRYNLKVLPVLGYYNNISIRRVISNFLFSVYIFFILLFQSKKTDKVLIPSRPVELIFFISILKRIKRVEIYLDIQDIWPDALKISNRTKEKIFISYCNLFLKPSLKHYTNSFHVAPSFCNWLKRYAPYCPSVFLPLGWENKRWVSTEENNFPQLTKPIQLVCVAQLQHQIDVMPILKLLKTNKDIFLTIVGEDGKGERYEEVMSYITNNHIENVEIIGKVDRSEMPLKLRNKHIGILPMITTSIPNKIFDYMAAKLPIIVLGRNDSAEFVLENNIGWACEFDNHALKQLITDITPEDFELKYETLLVQREQYSRDNLHSALKEVIF